MQQSYRAWFAHVTGHAPYAWQERLAEHEAPRDQLLRIPTGLGKSAGTVLCWLYHRVVRGDRRWPARLVFALPMRTLVEQVAREVRRWVEHAGLEVPVHVLMGGVESSRWVADLEASQVLIGTQDMLLSRALNRGYGSARGLWPMEFGALHSDALWVFDEVQLMGVALATSTQLHGLRAALPASLRPTHSWWMSATLQPSWLDSIDFEAARRERLAEPTVVPAAERTGGVWDVPKRLHVEPEESSPERLCAEVLARHVPATQTLVVVNTVKRATELLRVLEKKLGKAQEKPDLRLAHSRFRPHERANWDFLGRAAEESLPPAGRILIATQVVEAGVDLSARTLITELAPYPSLVQRFGRAGRRAGSEADVVVVGSSPKDDRSAAPYTKAELDASRTALGRLVAGEGSASLGALERAEASWTEAERAEVYPYLPEHVLRRADLLDLFDTTADLSGADLDVGRYIRVGDERTAWVFWRAFDSNPPPDVQPPSREELCAVPFVELRDWLDKNKDVAAFEHDYELGSWQRARRIGPGQTVLLPSEAGGYSLAAGWDPASKVAVPPCAPNELTPRDELYASSWSASDESLSEAAWKSIAFHAAETAEEIEQLLGALGVCDELRALLGLAARWHDGGKAHPVFGGAIARRPEGDAWCARPDLAKAPASAWRRPPYPERPGFRHELASTLALFELLKRAAPDHPAVAGFRWPDAAPRESSDGDAATLVGHAEAETAWAHAPLAQELIALDADAFDLVAYLVCAHHGKVRMSWSSTRGDRDSGRDLVFGVQDGDALPAFALPSGAGVLAQVPPLELSLQPASMGLSERYGRSWVDRTTALLRRQGPFRLAYLEALLRAADWRASQRTTVEAR